MTNISNEEKKSILTELIGIKSVNGDETKVADYLKRLLVSHGIPDKNIKKVEYKEGRDSLVVDINPDGTKILGFTGHEDVVDPGPYDEWTKCNNNDPFDATFTDNLVYGRGVTDMKGGLAGLVITMIELNKDPEFNGHVRLLATVGEEIGMYGAKQLAAEGYVDDMSALIVGEPSNASSMNVLQHLLSTGVVPIPQPNPTTFNRHVIYSAHKGSIDYTVKSIGKEAHSSLPQQGTNAIDNLFDYYIKQQAYFEKLSKYSNKTLGSIVPVNTMINGGTQPNSVPSEATLTVKIRTIPEYNNEEIIGDLKNLVHEMNESNNDKNYKFEIDIKSNNFPVETSITADFIKMARETYREVWNGEESLVVGATGGTDAAQFVARNPELKVAIMGPGNESAHQINEFMNMDDYFNYMDVYKKMAVKFFSK